MSLVNNTEQKTNERQLLLLSKTRRVACLRAEVQAAKPVQRTISQEQITFPQIYIRSFIQEDHVIISIADNGPGMNEEVRKRLFDPFFTTKPVGKGTGMGLSISYQILVQKHGGKIQCISAPGEGAEFVVMIPLKQEPST